MPTSFITRRLEVAWKYDLPEGIHDILLKAKYLPEGYLVDIRDLVVYSNNNPDAR